MNSAFKAWAEGVVSWVRRMVPKAEYIVAGYACALLVEKFRPGSSGQVTVAVAWLLNAWDLMNYKQDER